MSQPEFFQATDNRKVNQDSNSSNIIHHILGEKITGIFADKNRSAEQNFLPKLDLVSDAHRLQESGDGPTFDKNDVSTWMTVDPNVTADQKQAVIDAFNALPDSIKNNLKNDPPLIALKPFDGGAYGSNSHYDNGFAEAVHKLFGAKDDIYIATGTGVEDGTLAHEAFELWGWRTGNTADGSAINRVLKKELTDLYNTDRKSYNALVNDRNIMGALNDDPIITGPDGTKFGATDIESIIFAEAIQGGSQFGIGSSLAKYLPETTKQLRNLVAGRAVAAPPC